MKIRVLTHLTVGRHQYKPGDLMLQRHIDKNPEWQAYARGEKLHAGQRILEFTAEPAPRIKKPAPAAVDPDPVAPAEEPNDLRSHILAAVREGQAKTALVKSVAKGLGVTQKAVGEEFEAIMASGLVTTDADGKNAVAPTPEGAQ